MLTIMELKQITSADVTKLPKLIVHPDWSWTGDAMPVRGNIYMNQSQLAAVRRQLPVKFVQRLSFEAELYEFDLQPHHLEAGRGDANEKPAEAEGARQAELRETLGYDGQTAEPKRDKTLH